jgi:ubiquinone/menaquinone biosynthesis C-methylase UbiE
MKIRESGMPEEKEWTEFFNPSIILEILGINNSIRDVADFGCGYGTFTIPAAKIIRGKIYAIDTDSSMITIVECKAKEYHLHNVVTIKRDFVAEGSGLKESSVDYVMLFNILHAEKPLNLLKEAYRILVDDGQVGIVHWNYDPTTPRGPPMEIRPKPEQCIKWAENVGFKTPRRYDLKPYHYGIVMKK